MVVTTILAIVGGCQGSPENASPATVAKGKEEPDPRLIDLAEQAVAEGRFRDGEDLVNRVLLYGDNKRARLVQAEIHLATGAPKEAVREFDELVADPTLSARALQGKGIGLLHNGVTTDAYEALQRAVAIDDALWRAWNALGYYHDSNGDWQDAVKSYDHALAANPESAEIYNNRGFSKLIQRQFDDAIEDLAKAIELDPGLEISRLNMRLALAWKGRYVQALLGVPDRDMGKALNNVGFIALLRGDFPAAESHFVRALETDASFNRAAWRNLGYLHDLKTMTGNDISNEEPLKTSSRPRAEKE